MRMHTDRALRVLSTIVLLSAQVGPALAQSTSTPAAPPSTVHTSTSDAVQRVGSVHGGAQTIPGGDLTGGQLSRILSGGGNLYVMNAGNHVNGNVVIPAGVTLVDLVSSVGNSLAVKGNVADFGSLLFMSLQSLGLTSANLAASKLQVAPSAVLSAVNTPGTQMSLNLSIAGALVNAGTISAGRDLNITAGTIINSPLGGSQALLSAGGDVNLVTGSGKILNNGAVIAQQNINMNALGSDTTLGITGNGVFNAANGAINIGNNRNNDIAMSGGDYISHLLNIHAINNAINANIGRVTGALNTQATSSNFWAATSTLNLGSNCVSGDPTYVNTSGNIVVTGVQTFNENVAIIASGNVSTASDGAIAGQIIAPGANVLIIAGAKAATTGATTSEVFLAQPANTHPATAAVTVTFDPSQSTGGNIDFSSGAALNVIDTSVTGSSKGAGNVTLVAMSNNGGLGGSVLLGTSGINAAALGETQGKLQKTGGDVTIIAGAVPQTKTDTVTIGQILTGGTFNNQTSNTGGIGGGVAIFTQQPTSTNANKTIILDTHGNITSGAIKPAGLTSKNASVNIVGDIITSGEGGRVNSSGHNASGASAGGISIIAGSDIATKNLYAFGAGGAGAQIKAGGQGPGGKGGNGGVIYVGSDTGSISIAGIVNTSGGGGGGGAGSGVKYPATVGGAGGVAAQVTIAAPAGPITVSDVYAVNGGAGGNGGGTSAGGGGGGGGSFGGGGGGGGDRLNSGGGGGGGTFGSGGAGGNNGAGGGSGTSGGTGAGGGQSGSAGHGGNALNFNSGGVGGTIGQGGTGANANSDPVGGNGGAAVNSSVTVSITAGAGLTAGGIQGGDVVLKSGGAGNMALQGVVAHNKQVTITTDAGNLTQPAANLIVAPTLTITSNSGAIGTQATPVHFSSPVLSISTGTGGGTSGVYLAAPTQNGAVVLKKANAINGTFSITNQGDLSTASGVTVVAKAVELETLAGTQGKGRSGNINAQTQTSSLKAGAGFDGSFYDGSLNISNKGGALTLEDVSGAFNFNLTHTVTSPVTGPSLIVNGVVSGAGTSVVINLNEAAGQTSGGGIVTTPTGSLNTNGNLVINKPTASDIGAQLQPLNTSVSGLQTNTAGNMYISNHKAISLFNLKIGSSTAASDTSFTLTNTGDVRITGPVSVVAGSKATSFLVINTSGNISTGAPLSNAACLTCVLSSKFMQLSSLGGSMGTNTIPLQLKTSELHVTAGGDAYLSNSSPALQVDGTTGNSNNIFQLLSTGAITVTPGSSIDAPRAVIVAGAGSINSAQSPASINAGVLTLRAPDSVYATTNSTSNVTVGSTPVGFNATPVNSNAANNFSLVAATATNLFLQNSMTAKNITLTALQMAVSSPITSTGVVTLTATGASGTIAVSAPLKAGTLSLSADSLSQTPTAGLTGTVINITAGSTATLNLLSNNAGTLNIKDTTGSLIFGWKQATPLKIGTVSGTPAQMNVDYGTSLTTLTPFSVAMLNLLPITASGNNSITTNGLITIAGNANTVLKATGTGTLTLNGGITGTGSGARTLTSDVGSIQVNGPLTGQVVNLTTTNGGKIFNTSLGVITAPGGLTVNLQKAGTADLSAAAGQFAVFTDNVTGVGSVKIASAQALNLTIHGPQQNLTIVTTGGITTPTDIEASSVNITAGAPGISSPGQPLKTAATAVALSVPDSAGNVFANLTNAAGVTLAGTAGSNFVVTATGKLTTVGPIAAAIVDLTSAGGIVLGGTVGSATSTVKLTTTGTGAMGGKGQVVGQTVTLKFDSGNVGSGTAPLQTSTTNLTVNSTLATGGGGVNINNVATALVQLQPSTAGKGFVLRTTGPFQMSDLAADDGTGSSAAQVVITVTSGAFTILPNSTIKAIGGNMALVNLDSANGSIDIGLNSTLTASSTVTNVGNVGISMSNNTVQTPGTQPPNITPDIQSGGKIFYGANPSGITAYAPSNTLHALGRNITFDTGKAKDGSIKLEGGVNITADPPAGMEIIPVLTPRVAMSSVRLVPTTSLTVNSTSASAMPNANSGTNSSFAFPLLTSVPASALTQSDLTHREKPSPFAAAPEDSQQRDVAAPASARLRDLDLPALDEVVIDTDAD